MFNRRANVALAGNYRIQLHLVTQSYSFSDDGLYLRIVNDKEVWSKRDNGIWFIGNADKTIALSEKRHSIHQMIPAV